MQRLATLVTGWSVSLVTEKLDAEFSIQEMRVLRLRLAQKGQTLLRMAATVILRTSGTVHLWAMGGGRRSMGIDK
jgi:hypothetical protein